MVTKITQLFMPPIFAARRGQTPKHNRHKRPWFLNVCLTTAILLLSMAFTATIIAQPTRQGALDLTNQEGDAMSISGFTLTNLSENLANTPFTIEMWVKMAPNPGNEMVLFKLDGGPYKLSLSWLTDHFLLEAEGGDLNNYWTEINMTTPDFLNTWNYVSFTYDGENGVRISVNNKSYWKALHNAKGAPVSNLFPGLYPMLYIGGHQLRNGSLGKMYVGEVRVWRTALSGEVLKEYRNEEVNPGHPNWNKLYRYYHCTSDYTVGSKVYLPSAIPNYPDAAVSDNVNNRVVNNQSPPVCPPRIASSTFDVSATASTCGSDTIWVNWSDFGDKTKYNYLLEHEVNYQLVRDDNTANILYDGQDTTYTDINVSGGDKFRYKIRTYWNINGTKYYSKDELWSNDGMVKNHYIAPDLTATTDNCDGTITLDWTAGYTAPAWNIQQSTFSNFSDGVLTLSSNLDGSKSTYTDKPPMINTNYYYRIIATGTDENGCTVEASYSSIATGYSAGLPSPPDNVMVTPDTDAGSIIISWIPADLSADSWIVKRTDEDGTNPVEFKDITTTSYTDNTVSSCKIYKYSVGGVNTCSAGKYFETKSASISSTDLDNKISFLNASKGYYGDGVELKWGINGTFSTIDGFILERSESGEDNYQTIASLNNLQTLYKDQTALGGILYDYRIQATADCSGNLVYSNDATDLGFTLPFGVANGHVEYKGGNAVENVKVKIEPKEGMGGKSLYFDGNNDYVKIDNFNGVEGNNSRTIEAWVKMPINSRSQTMLYYGYWDVNTFYQNVMLGVDNFGNLEFNMRGSGVTVEAELNDGQWHHVAWVVPEGASVIGDVKMYVDGELDTLVESTGYGPINTVSTGELYIGSDIGFSEKYFRGYIDEVRFWDRERTDAEIEHNYNRLLNGNEDGLIGYWRCDEGVGNKIYDASKTGSGFNKHDGVFVNGVNWTDDTPSGDQLSLSATTDEYGDYSADYIPYRQGGELYKVTPSLGVHGFSPNSKTIFLGNGDATQNNLDFTDISSFNVSGKVTYYNSTFPVQGVQILIDGDYATGADKNIVTTDATGHFTIDIPIGYHYISVVKDGHVFSSGYFPPKKASGDFNYYEFNDDLSGIEFIDSTLVKVLGRVDGGTVEGDKEVGFGLSTNNVGVADVIFKAQNEAYDLDVADSTIFSVKTVQTDASTGEFEIYLIPEKFEIQKAGNDTYSIDVNDLSTLDLSNSLTPVTVYDSTLIESTDGDYYRVDTAWYHHKLNFVIREAPNVEITDLNGNEFVGDSMIYFTNQLTGLADTLDLASTNPYLHPILQMGKTYTANIFVYEEYSNPNHPDGAVVDKVPVDKANLTIDNQLEITGSGATASTDETGYYQYSFKAGTPSITKDLLTPENSFTKLMQVYATTDKITVEWREANPFRGYILGAFPIAGTDFVTYGYEVPEIVLRDPPGSHSYAYIEQGSEFSRTTSWELNFEVNSGLDNTIHAGAKLAFGGGLAGAIIESEIINDSELGLQITRSTDNEGSYKETTTFNRRIETSSDPEDVGSDADLYIGHAKNAYFTQSKNLRLLPEQFCMDNGLDYIAVPGAEYVLGIINGLVMDEGNTSTYFVYSQKHILSELVPNLIVARDNLLASSKYRSNLPRTSPYYGLNNDDNSLERLKSDSLSVNPSFDVKTASYVFLGDSTENDSVQFFNEQITYWMNAIATNEAEKINAETFNNISIDGSSGAYSESVSQSFNSEYNWKSTRQLKFKWNAKFGTLYTGLGYTGNSIFNIAGEVANGSNESENNKVTFGYAIDERDEGDYYSIDVKREKGVPIYSYNNFTESVTSKEDFLENQVIVAGIGAGSLITSTGIRYIAMKLASKSNYWASAAAFGFDMAVFTGELGNMLYNTFDTYEDMDGNQTWDVTGFDIGSPIFSVRGGQSKCPYEGEQYSIFALDAQKNLAKLHTATLQREVPVIDVEKALITDVPETNKASFVLKLQNHSASNTDNWYELSIDESTNPYGAILKIDGNSPEKEYLVPAWETLTKTLTVEKGQPEVYEYDSIGIILHSVCQWNPADLANDIADTVYISVHFAPSCTPVDIKGMQDNWVLNYNDNGEMGITLTGYDINYSTLEKIQFQYKTLTGSAVSTKAYFADTGTAYNEYSGEKQLLSGSAQESFVWDVSSLNDRAYMIRARSTCSDGSTYESPWYSGLIDSKPPKVFGTPSPGDGILSPGEDISIRFDEALEQGIITENNISLTGVLNGSEITHNTSLYFNGLGNYCSVSSGIVLTNSPFTIEFWLKRADSSPGVIFSQGANASDNLETGIDGNGMFYLQIAGQTFSGDPSVAYNTVYPATAWHHYAAVYDQDGAIVSLYVDDQNILSQSVSDIAYTGTGKVYIGRSATQTANYLYGNLHEFRIWNDARMFAGEIYANLYTSLSGREQGASRIWEMNEGEGNIVVDKVKNQVMDINAEWSIEPSGRSVYFNGTNQYLELDGTQAVIDDETDFTIEFWFKGSTPVASAALFSNGMGNGNEVMPGIDASRFLSIYATTNGSIVVSSNGNIFNAVTNNYFDNQWHHFALVVDRSSNAKAYIDATLQNSTPADRIAAFFNSKIWAGAMGWQIDPLTYGFGSYFNGYMDEIRIWNTTRTEKELKLYYKTKLNGTETGLLGYYPFENYEEVSGVQMLTETWTDQWVNPYGNNNGDALAVNGTSISTDAAEVKDARPVQDIPFDFVVNTDEIIITPNIDPSKIENTVLEIGVKDVFDLNGNRLLSPATWTAYIDRNQVVWLDDKISLEKPVGESLSFTATIKNIGGVAREFEIGNIPDWLTASVTSDVIEPNGEIEVHFTINQGINNGYYDENLLLSTDFGYNEPFNINLRVYTPAPEWTVDESKYQYIANVIGKLKIAGNYSTDIYDKIGVFAGNECRGVANVSYVENRDEYYVFLTIYGNNSLEDLTCKVWDASAGEVYADVAPGIVFIPNNVQGSASNPVVFECGYLLDNSISLVNGWKWISFNLDMSNYNGANTLFSNVNAQSGDLIKSEAHFATYDSGFNRWVGSGLTLNAGKMYKVKLSSANTLYYSGQAISPSDYPISISNGWNRVGYIPRFNLETNQALAAYNAVENDVIKSQTKFAVYDGYQWLGTLDYMKPGEGYMLWSQTTDSVTFSYPDKSSLSSLKSTVAENRLVTSFAKNVVNPYAYQGSVSVVAHINATELPDDVLIGAFINGELRGVGTLNVQSSNLKGYTMLTAFGNTDDDGTEINFAMLNGEEVYELEGTTTFESDNIQGSLSSPVELNLAGELAEKQDVGLTMYPNPFNNEVNINFSLDKNSDVVLEVYNLLGEKMSIPVHQNMITGSHTISLGVKDISTQKLSPGIYLFKLKIDGKDYQYKMVKTN